MLVQFVRLLGRYLGAITAACAVSLGAFAIGLPVVMLVDYMPAFAVLLVIVGFSGVFLGALRLPISNRRFGSFALLLSGLWFYSSLVLSFIPSTVPPSKPLIWNLPLAGGGLMATLAVCFWRRRPNPQCGANGPQSLSSDTNPTSSGTGPRRSP